MNICKALLSIENDISIPLVVIGEGGKYKEQVKDFIKQNGLNDRIIFLSQHPIGKKSSSFRSAADFPAIYQSALAMIYPSFYEGFGIPVLEALWSRLPVITSNLSCLPEAGGDAAYYVDPGSVGEIAEAMRRIYSNKDLRDSMSEKGWEHALKFTPQKHAEGVMNVYNSVW